jgi:hypothetical protein
MGTAILKLIGTVVLLSAAKALAQSPPSPTDDAPAPSDADQRKILAQITENALKYRQTLPDFVCSKLTRRNADQTGTSQHWRQIDSVDEELTFVNQKESYKQVSVNGKKSSGGNRTPGPDYEFGSLMSSIFDPKAHADFKWHSWTTLNQRRTYVFAYSIMPENSQFTIGFKAPKTVGFAGLFYADVESGMVMHIFVIAQSPPNFALTNVTYDLLYDFVKIGDRQFVMPVKSDFHGKDGKSLIWNEVEFRRYRKAGADPADQFDKR